MQTWDPISNCQLVSWSEIINALIKGINEEYLSDVCGKVVQGSTVQLG
jgi:hypothetical protein